MLQNDVPPSLDSTIEHIITLPVEQRDALVNQVLEMLMPHFEKWAARFCMRSGDTGKNHLDDMVSESALTVHRVLMKAGPREPGTQMRWYFYLHKACERHAKTYFQSAARTTTAGMSGMMRRRQIAVKGEDELTRRLQRTPTPQEVVDHVNGKMRASRADPKKQGVIITVDDLVNTPVAATVNEAVDIAVYDRDDDAILSEPDGMQLVHMIVIACREQSPDLGKVAAAWIGDLYSPGEVHTVTEISRELGIPLSTTHRQMAAVQSIAREVAGNFGIDDFLA